MAHTILGLDLGTWSVKSAVLATSFRGFEVSGLHEEPLSQDPGTPYLDRLRDALRRMKEDGRLEGEVQVVAAPGNLVSTHVIGVPFSDRKRISQTIGFEVEGVLPVDIDDVVYDYVISPKASGGADVHVAVIDRDALAELLEMLAEIGIDPRVLDLDAGCYLHLAGRSFWPELAPDQDGKKKKGGKKKSEAPPPPPEAMGEGIEVPTGPGPMSDAVMVLDIGFERTNVCIIERNEGKGEAKPHVALARTFRGGASSYINYVSATHEVSENRARKMLGWYGPGEERWSPPTLETGEILPEPRPVTPPAPASVPEPNSTPALQNAPEPEPAPAPAPAPEVSAPETPAPAPEPDPEPGPVLWSSEETLRPTPSPYGSDLGPSLTGDEPDLDTDDVKTAPLAIPQPEPGPAPPPLPPRPKKDEEEEEEEDVDAETDDDAEPVEDPTPPEPLPGAEVEAMATAALRPLTRAIFLALHTWRASGGSEPKRLSRIYVAGGLIEMPGVLPAFQAALPAPIEMLPPPPSAHSAKLEPPPTLAKAMSLALRDVAGAAQSRFNLRTGEFAFKSSFEFVRDRIPRLAVSLLVIVLLAAVNAYTEHYLLQARERQLEARLSEFSRKVLGNPIANFTVVKVEMQRKGNPNTSTVVPTFSAVDILNEIGSRKPEGIVIDQREIEIALNKVRMKGETDSFEAVDRFIEALGEYHCFKNVKKGRVRTRQIPGGNEVIEFGLAMSVDCSQ